MPASTMITVAPLWAGSVDALVRTVQACAEIGASVVDAPPEGSAVREHTDLLVWGADVVGCPLDDWERAVGIHTGQVVPLYEISAAGQLKDLQRLLDQHGLPYGGKVHCDLRGLGSVPELAAAMAALPAEATFTASGDGPAALPMMLAAIAAGGHLRVPLADNPRDNAQRVARAAGLARIAQRPPATPAEVRELLGVPA